MKWEERIAYGYLECSGFRQIVYEPKGQRPPDFSINNETGVEVRRLSQQYISGLRSRGLEEDGIGFERKVKSVLSEFDAGTPVDSFWVVLDYKRPLGRLRTASIALRHVLSDFLTSTYSHPVEFAITPNVRIAIHKASIPSRKRFRIGAHTDQDSGGWVIVMYSTAISHCIKDKLRKIEAYKAEYNRWWLVLVDMIICDREPDTIAAIRQQTPKPAEFERIIIIDPITKTMTFEL